MRKIAAVAVVLAGLVACSNEPAVVAPRHIAPLPDPDRPFYCMVDLDCLRHELETAAS